MQLDSPTLSLSLAESFFRTDDRLARFGSNSEGSPHSKQQPSDAQAQRSVIRKQAGADQCRQHALTPIPNGHVGARFPTALLRVPSV